MVDADIAIEGLVQSGKLLTLTAQRQRARIIDLIAASREEVLAEFGLGGEAKIAEPTQNWAEKLARFLTDPTVSSLLLVLGFSDSCSKLLLRDGGVFRGGLLVYWPCSYSLAEDW